MEEVKRTYIAIVLDRSGSMKHVRKAIIEGYNQNVAAIRSESVGDGCEVFISLYFFNHDVEAKYRQMSVNFLQELSEEEYVCEGDTAMYEAVGRAVKDLQDNTAVEDPSNSYLVKVFSDGHNNRLPGMPNQPADRYTWSQAALSQEIARLRGTDKWTFEYVGSNHDLFRVADGLGLAKGCVANYAAGSRGSAVAFAASARQTSKFLKMRNAAPVGQHFNVANFHSDKPGDIADYAEMSLQDVEQDKKAVLAETVPTNSAKAIWRNS